ncbi:MAG: ROK family protein [Calditrichia bacterium]
MESSAEMMNSQQEIVVGADIGGTNTGLGLFKPDGEYISRSSFSTNAGQPVQDFLERFAEKIRGMISRTNGNLKLAGIGIAAPAANYFEGTIESATNFAWGKVNLVGLVQDYFKVPTVVVNDAKAAALGEMEYGAAKGLRNFMVITLGTGLGCGVVIDGKILLGERGLSNEIGHTIVRRNGRQCACGRRGCLEAYVSAEGLRRNAMELVSDRLEDSTLRTIPFDELTAKTREAFEYTGRILGESLADAAAHYSPRAIVLFGGLVNAGNFLLNPVRRHLKKNLLNIYDGQVRVLRSSLQEENAAVLGAGALIRTELGQKNTNI